MSTNTASLTARLGVTGTLEWRDASGVIVGTTEVTGSFPLNQEDALPTFLPLLEGTQDGTDNRE